MHFLDALPRLLIRSVLCLAELILSLIISDTHGVACGSALKLNSNPEKERRNQERNSSAAGERTGVVNTRSGQKHHGRNYGSIRPVDS